MESQSTPRIKNTVFAPAWKVEDKRLHQTRIVISRWTDAPKGTFCDCVLTRMMELGYWHGWEGGIFPHWADPTKTEEYLNVVAHMLKTGQISAWRIVPSEPE
jgi:hypothetical protein